MSGLGARLAGRLEHASAGVVAGLAMVLVFLLGAGDIWTGAEVSSSVFYLMPVGAAAWFAGPAWGGALAVLAASVWYGADMLAGATYSAAWIPWWNAGVRLSFFLLVAHLLTRLRRSLEAQRSLAESDVLTGLPNNRRFLAALDVEMARSVRYRRPVSLAYIDLDGFKAVNDQRGHRAGDEVLRLVGRVMSDQVRLTDVPARLGGDEFAVLFPETGADAVRAAMEKLRSSLEAAMAAGGWPVGFSVGVYTAAGEIETGQELIRLADELMYEVKRSGKGRTTFRVGGPRVTDGSVQPLPG